MEDIKIPIFIGNTNTFCLVTFDHDEWNPSINDINLNSYKYEKLCRTTCNFDVGIAPLSMIIGFDGSLILPAIDKCNSSSKALEIYNVFLANVLLGGIFIKAIEPVDISQGFLNGIGYFRIFEAGEGGAAKFHQAAQLKSLNSLDAIRLLNPQKILKSDLEKAFWSGSKYSSALGYSSLSLLIKGITHYSNNLYTEALVCLWTFIEQLIDNIWRLEIVNVGNAHAGHKSFLQDNRTWTIAAKSEMLYQKNFLDIPTYASLSKIRKVRNDLIHNGTVPSDDAVICLIKLVLEIISLIKSRYVNKNELDKTFEIVCHANSRDVFAQREKGISTDQIEYWREIPPIPGDKEWGDKSFDDIAEIHLIPIDKE